MVDRNKARSTAAASGDTVDRSPGVTCVTRKNRLFGGRDDDAPDGQGAPSLARGHDLVSLAINLY
jgi:hypothetical protein